MLENDFILWGCKMIAIMSYNRERAVEYAKRWARGRNPLFFDFTGGGGNCTSFVSQCLWAGSLSTDPSQPFGWYYVSVNDRAPAFSGVNEFYAYLCGVNGFPPVNSRRGPFAVEVMREMVQIGDVVQLANRSGRFYHTLIVSGFDPSLSDGGILVCANSDDALDRPLSTYNYAAVRFLHVLGVNIETNGADELYTGLLDGTALPPANLIYSPAVE